MADPSTPSVTWSARVRRTLSWWRERRRREAPKRVLTLDPPCSKCGDPAARVVLFEFAGGWRLTFCGVDGSNNGGGDPVSGEKAQAILDALTPPYETARIQAAGFYDDFGFCVPCAAFYCATHWQVSPTGFGTCPAGHGKSLDPHWHPDWEDL